MPELRNARENARLEIGSQRGRNRALLNPIDGSFYVLLQGRAVFRGQLLGPQISAPICTNKSTGESTWGSTVAAAGGWGVRRRGLAGLPGRSAGWALCLSSTT